MKSLDIGMKLPLDMVTATTAILAKKGGGKSYLASVLAEDIIAAGQPVAIIDPTDAWWGLRAKADGSPNGLPIVIFGGDHADLPLKEGMGAIVADLLVDGLVTSCILCTKSFESDASRIRFLTTFGARLFHRSRSPLHVFMDECDDYLPQRLSPEQTKLLHVWSRIVKQGRKQGLGVTMISQRAAVVHKDVLSQIDTLFMLRTTAPHDIKAMGDWIRAKKEGEDGRTAMAVLDTLPALKIGQAYCYSPGFLELASPSLFTVRRRQTFDSGATPKVGEKRIEPKSLAKVDLEALRESLKTTIEKAKADDPKELRRRIAELEAKVVSKAVAATPAPTFARVEVPVPVISPEAMQVLRDVRMAVDHLREDTHTLLNEIEAKIPKDWRRPAQPLALRTDVARAIADAPKSVTNRPSRIEGIDGGAKRMLEAMASFHPTALSRAQIATLAGLSAQSGTFSTYLSRLSTAGLIDREGGSLVELTEAGLEAAGGPGTPRTPRELLETWSAKFDGGAKRMLGTLFVDAGWMSRADLAASCDLSAESGTFSTYLSRLHSNGLIEKGPSGVRISRWFFMSEAAQ